jgi:membrane protein
MPPALKSFIALMRETAKEWSEDGASRIAAALAYYAIFSLSPLLIFIAIVLGLAIDQRTLESSIIDGVQTTVGSQGAEILRSLISNVRLDRSSIIGSIISISIVIWGASNLFSELQHALNKIWEVRVRPGGTPVTLIISRVESFGILALAAFGLLITTLLNTTVTRWINGGANPEALFGSTLLQIGVLSIPEGGVAAIFIRPLQFVISVAILTGIIAMIFKILPDVVMRWRDVLVGAAFTATLLFLGQFLVGLYLSNSNVGSVFGAAGSLTAILVWIYYTAQILLFGAEFTEVWARNHGVTIRPNRYAVWVNEFQARREAEKAGVDFESIHARHAKESQRQQEAWEQFTRRTKRVAKRVAENAAERTRRRRNRASSEEARIVLVDGDGHTGIELAPSERPAIIMVDDEETPIRATQTGEMVSVAQAAPPNNGSTDTESHTSPVVHHHRRTLYQRRVPASKSV